MMSTNDERNLIEGMRALDPASVARFHEQYEPVARRILKAFVQVGFFPGADPEQLIQDVLNDFFFVIQDENPIGENSIDNLLYFLVFSRAVASYIEGKKETFSRLGLSPLERPSSELPAYEEPWFLHPRASFTIPQRLLIVKGDETLTPRYLSSAIVPYVEAVSSLQRVCNAVLGRPPSEVVVYSISRYSPTDIKLVDAAEAINALKEDIIPWRRKHAQSLAALKEEEVSADIKKKEAEALEIRARSIKEEAESAKTLAEAAKLREEAEQQRLENDKRRFELQKARLELALDIVSKMNPDMPLAERYAHAMQLLPSLNTLTESPIEPGLIE